MRRRRRRVFVVFSAKKVFTNGIGGRRQSEGQFEAWHIDRGKRALLGSRRKRLRRVGLSYKYGTRFTDPWKRRAVHQKKAKETFIATEERVQVPRQIHRK